jgi:hypothetical protein
MRAIIVALTIAILSSSHAQAQQGNKGFHCGKCPKACQREMAQGIRGSLAGCIAHCQRDHGCPSSGPL